MRLIAKENVQAESWYPNECVVTKRGDIDLIDTGQTCEPNPAYESFQVYLGAEYVKQLAEDLLGMKPASEVQELEEKIASLKEKHDELEKQINAFGALNELLGELEKEKANGTPV